MLKEGIIYIDEFDKIARKSENAFNNKEMFLVKAYNKPYLKIIEGTKSQVPPEGGRKAS